jgi:hypothetical protein
MWVKRQSRSGDMGVPAATPPLTGPVGGSIAQPLWPTGIDFCPTHVEPILRFDASIITPPGWPQGTLPHRPSLPADSDGQIRPSRMQCHHAKSHSVEGRGPGRPSTGIRSLQDPDKLEDRADAPPTERTDLGLGLVATPRNPNPSDAASSAQIALFFWMIQCQHDMSCHLREWRHYFGRIAALYG